MSILEDLSKLKYRNLLFYFLCISSLFCPGLLIIYLYKHNLFASLNPLTLTLFSLALSSPVVIINFLITFTLGRGFIGEEQDVEERIFLNLFASCLFSFLISNLSILVAYLFKWGFKLMVIEIVCFEGLLIVLFILALTVEKKNKK